MSPKSPPPPKTVNVEVDFHQFTIGHYEGQLDHLAGAKIALVWAVTATSATVSTGIASGYVRVTCRPLNEAPTAPDDGWEDVMEVSLETTPDWPLSAAGHWGGEEELADRLDVYGPGTYRLRVHAKGRDIDYDGSRLEPVEDYLILAWPAPAGPTTVLRATSQVGQQEQSERTVTGHGDTSRADRVAPPGNGSNRTTEIGPP